MVRLSSSHVEMVKKMTLAKTISQRKYGLRKDEELTEHARQVRARLMQVKRAAQKERGLIEPIQDDDTMEIKRSLVIQIEDGMREAGLTKTEMARRMGTARAQLDRLLNPGNPSTTLQTLVRAASAVGKKVVVSLVEFGSN